MTYIDEARELLEKELPGQDDALLDLYLLLVLSQGAFVTLEDVHDAWAIWRSRTRPDHKSIIPFNDLTEEIQELDRKYMDAIVRVSDQLKKER